MRFSVVVSRIGRDEVADPTEETATADPQAGRNNQPENAPQPLAVVNLADARKDKGEYARCSWVFHISIHVLNLNLSTLQFLGC